MIANFSTVEQGDTAPQPIALAIENLSLTLSGNAILREVNIDLPQCGITSLIGPSGAGKSSLLRCINGLQQGWQGQITLAGQTLRGWPGGWDQLRRHIGLVAQKPAVFPVSIRENVIFGLTRQQRRRADAVVEQSLQQAALWDEVKGRLDAPAATLSLGQQQRLCIARALAIAPQLLLLDEPTASLDPRSKQLIEESIITLSQQMPILSVTHDLEQSKRFAGQVIFMCEGKVIECGEAKDFFRRPQRLESREFLHWSVCDCD